ncbi:hypothetical protein GOP47_0013573 [Adiantum capillus-veneris]|uniref:C2 domain-containing protein n=1 Tax=Adiantum capillus-veneris TaxID=13818 RepID=A0A9D4UPR2_ADICA|nr:hypothetical protein GOP47_0013573 [Adiantum capillus-veneris]
MSVQDQLLDITVIGCRNLKDTEWISRQDPYVILEYAGNKYRTQTDTDGGRNPNFNEKYMLPLIEGLREINVAVWNSNTLSADDFIGSGKIILQKVFTDGYHDSTWPLTTRSGRRAGEIRVILHYKNPKGAQKVSSVQQVAPTHQSPPVYPPANLAYYPPPPYAAASPYPPPSPSDCSCYPPIYAPSYPPPAQAVYPTYSAGAYTPPAGFGAQSPYPPQSYPPPTYPPQGYGAPPAAGHYPPY